MSVFMRRLALVLLFVALLVPAIPVAAISTVVTVTTTADSTNGCATGGSAPCSLRDAVTYANAHGNTTILFQSGLGGTIILGSTLSLDTSMTITGPSANVLAVDGNNATTVFAINNNGASGVTVNISGLTIQHGNAGAQGAGGGITVFIANLNLTDSAVVGNTSGMGSGGIAITAFSGSDSVVAITRSTISGNSSGAIFNQGSLTVTNSTISGNTVTGGGFGGGIRAVSGATTVVNSTISNNVAISGAQVAIQGGISAAGGSVSLQNTIVAGNTRSDGTPADVTGAITSQEHNLIGNTSGGSGFGMSDLTDVNPLLGPLLTNGGPTQTQALLPTSPALDAIPTTGAGCPITDQRGISRPQGGACDIGAYELATSVSVQANAPANGNGTDVPFPTISEGVGNVIAGGTVHVAANTNTVPTYNDHVTIDRNVTITGTGATTTIVDGTNSGAVFTINDGMTVTLSGVTIQHGKNSNDGGGGIANHGSLTLADSVVTNSSAGDGGGILTDGSALTLTTSTVSGNTSTSSGGGIFIGSGTVHITGSTISGNTMSGRGAGIFNGGTLTLTNSTVSGNAANPSGGSAGGIDNDFRSMLSLVNDTLTRNSPDGLYNHNGGSATARDTIIAGNLGFDISGTVTSNGNNLVGNTPGSGITNGMHGDIAGTFTSPVDPLLAPLALNAPGTTQTHALGPTSPAIDAGGACPSGVTTDQRGVGRIQGNACDIGAYEYVPVTPTLQSAQTGTAGQRLVFTGSGFQTGTTVTVNGASLPITVATGGQSFTAPVPAHAAGTVPVVVTNPGTGHTATSSLTYAVPNVAPSPPRPSASLAMGTPPPMPAPRPPGVSPSGATPNPVPPSR